MYRWCIQIQSIYSRSEAQVPVSEADRRADIRTDMEGENIMLVQYSSYP